MVTRSLQADRHPLSSAQEQLRVLESIGASFDHRLAESAIPPLEPARPDILQINIGYQCNQTCRHCHVDAGPDRKERMSEQTSEQVVDWLQSGAFTTLDITGGAPEMHARFRWLVDNARKTPVQEIIVRSNLTILVANPSYAELPAYFRDNRVRICSSLPFHQASRTDRQRGEGVFEKSIRALRLLNDVGYGMPGSGLILDLVYNPSGAFLPGDQTELENEFREALRRDHDIAFNRLFTITNVPISRFLDFLIRSGNLEMYMEKLVNSFNPAAVSGLMCRNTISVDWQGNLYDCDFNQMLDLKMALPVAHIGSMRPDGLQERRVVTRPHCFACTAGNGSSCQGATV